MKFIPYVALLLLLCGCTRTLYVPVETVKTEFRDRVRRDSVIERDSIYLFIHGDTVIKYVDRWRDRYHYLKDTVHIVDSVEVPVPYEVVKQVRHIPRVYRWAFWLCLGIIGYGLLKLILKFK